MFKKNAVIKGTILLTLSGILSRILGFLYRIFLSNLIGARGMGIFQLIFPVLVFCTSLSCGGIQIAVSRFVAESKSRAQCFMVLTAGVLMSAFLSVLTCSVLFCFSEPVSKYIIQNAQCGELLRYASLTIPMSAFHSCVSGYYLGLKKTFVPAWSAVFEQAVKLISLCIISMVLAGNQIEATPLSAVCSMIIAEFCGVLFCLTAICSERKFKIYFSGLFKSVRSLFSVSYMLTINKIMLTFLQCFEAVLIPVVLVKSGESETDALSVYGILTGMSLPVIFFPSAFNNSVSTMILPTIAKANTSGRPEDVKRTTELSVWFSMVTGIFCTGVFLFYGNFIGEKIFSQPLAGKYIQTLSWLCPFMYLSIALGSVLHGLGKTSAAFWHNVFGTAIRLLFLWFLVPITGITGYLYGLLASNLAVTLLHGFYIHKFVKFEFSPVQNIIIPTAWLICSLSVGELLKFIFSFVSFDQNMSDYVSALFCACAIFAVFGYFVLREIREPSRI